MGITDDILDVLREHIDKRFPNLFLYLRELRTVAKALASGNLVSVDIHVNEGYPQGVQGTDRSSTEPAQLQEMDLRSWPHPRWGLHRDVSSQSIGD